MFKPRQKEVTQEDIDFLKKYHQKQLETNEKKYAEWQLELVFIVGLLCGGLMMATSIGTLQFIENSRNIQQIERS
ncbi:MAG: hypothetical protein F6K23_36005 [Okeania sp. SIO2C9]|uniref:hypothetical protein n=1 Tax=Okeania sp. SIO2C9 TaxID=2607791 RepID=UPI0013C1DA94|nr:hypothetical protein [Okeania sp. SIO2C9]NEQ77943.1 hypothetical protein [Okeania sp. SIO2C9]